MRHFEKKGAMRLFRRVGTKGSTLLVEVGAASEDTHRVSQRFPSAKAAGKAAEAWARWSTDWGYAEVFYDAGETAGIVRGLEGPRGPGRVRTDSREDVYFAEGAASELDLEVGDRVLVRGIRAKARPAAKFMFGSKLACESVRAFPEPRWSQWRAAPELPEKTRRALQKLAGPGIAGEESSEGGRRRPLGKLAPGALIYSYEKGVHRFLSKEPGKDGLVYSEPVLDSKLGRQSFRVLECLAEFCEPLPKRFRRELERHLGLGI